MYREIVFIHVFAALAFFMAHGAAVAMIFKLHQEREPARMRAILDLSNSMDDAGGLSLLALLVAGIVAGFMGNWWSQGWIGVALLLLIALAGHMVFYVGRYVNPLRVALGLPHPRNKKMPVSEPLPDEEIHALVDKINPWQVFLPALIITIIILWLMMYKPF